MAGAEEQIQLFAFYFLFYSLFEIQWGMGEMWLNKRTNI